MKPIHVLLRLHAVATFCAAWVLVLAPSWIPSVVGMQLQEPQYLICYLLAAAELAMAYLSWQGARINEAWTLKIIIQTFMVLHASSLVLELYVWFHTMSGALFANCVFRLMVCALFYVLGVRTLSSRGGAKE